jgi:hypothetical protein
MGETFAAAVKIGVIQESSSSEVRKRILRSLARYRHRLQNQKSLDWRSRSPNGGEARIIRVNCRASIEGTCLVSGQSNCVSRLGLGVVVSFDEIVIFLRFPSEEEVL